MTTRTPAGLSAVLLLVVAACGSPAPSASPAANGGASPSLAPAPSESAAVASATPTVAIPVGPQVVPDHGTFTGQVSGPTGTYPVVLWMDGCGHTAEVCGDIEYSDPKHPEFTYCAPQLVFTGWDGGKDVFRADPAYRADRCPQTTIKVGKVGSGDTSGTLTLALEVSGGPAGSPCCQGTLTQTSDQPPGDEPPPSLPAIDGLTGPLSTAGLGAPTNQYSAADSSKAYFPTLGELVSVVLDTGESDEMVSKNGDIASPSDPRAVTTIGDAIWVTRGPTKTLERVDVTPAAAATLPIQLPHTPYALAADGTTLWVTSLEDSVVMAVDTATYRVTATVDVPKPAGIAVGGGSVWVVEHADGKLARIDPRTAKVTGEVALGQAGDDPACGSCAEDVIYAFGSAWTANDLGRSITRVDGRTLKATTFPTANRVWSVAAYDGHIYGSQYEAVDGYIDRGVGGLVRIDPKKGTVDQLPAPGVRGVAALGHFLWLIAPGRRGDIVLSYKVAAR